MIIADDSHSTTYQGYVVLCERIMEDIWYYGHSRLRGSVVLRDEDGGGELFSW